MRWADLLCNSARIKLKLSLFFALALFHLTCLATSHAGIISASSLFTANPHNAWAYSESPSGQPPSSSISYFPTATEDFAAAVFQGFVTTDPDLKISVGGDSWTGSGFESFQIFSTYIRSSSDQLLSIGIVGDDGHSLFVDHVFRSGAGFGGLAKYDLQLEAGVVHKITLAGYNGPGNWVFGIGVPIAPLPNNNPQLMASLGDMAGIEFNAVGFGTQTVPEPSSHCAMAILGVAAMRLRRRAARKQAVE